MIHGGLLTRSGQDTAPLLACNETLAVNGLCLSEAQAQMLLRTQRQTLEQTGCLAFRADIPAKLALAFADSAFLTQETFADTLCTFIALFYHFKNETAEQYSDDALIAAMRHAFENTCGGSVQKLADEALPALARRCNMRRCDPWEVLP